MPHKGHHGTPMHVERVPAKPKRRRRDPFTKAGPVTVIRPDGSTEVLPAYTPREFNRIVATQKRKSGRSPRRSRGTGSGS